VAGELPSYLAYLANVEPEAFRESVGFFGARCGTYWRTAAGVDSGGDLYVAVERKYTGWMQLQTDTGAFADVTHSTDAINYFRTWHWYYRFSMAGRTIEQYRRRMWDMARLRIRDVRAAPWNANGLTAPAAGGATRPATIGDVFTSERAIALIIRWHVWNPGSIVSGGNAAPRIRDALTRSGILTAVPGAGTDTSVWTNAHEADLIDGIFDKLNDIIAGYAADAVDLTLTAAQRADAQRNRDNWTDFRTTMEEVRDWPRWAAGANPRNYSLDAAVGTLSANRGSFNFHDAGLPPSP
jgi:hypothetical protein